MGNAQQTLLGGSSATSGSSNVNNNYLKNGIGSNVTNGTAAGSQIADMLGLNGTPAQNQGFTNWQNGTGYQFGLNQGLQSVTGNAAASGLVNSGGNEKALETYGQNYANTQYGNYNNQLQNLLGAGNTSAGIIGSTGNVSNSNSSSSPGVMGGIGQLLAK